jgi:hypothetical protein
MGTEKSSVWEERQRVKCGDEMNKGGCMSFSKRKLMGSERMRWARLSGTDGLGLYMDLRARSVVTGVQIDIEVCEDMYFMRRATSRLPPVPLQCTNIQNSRSSSCSKGT